MGLQGVKYPFADWGLYGNEPYFFAAVRNTYFPFRHHPGDGHIYEGQSV